MYGVCGAVIYTIMVFALTVGIEPIREVLTIGAVGGIIGFLLGGTIGGFVAYVNMKRGEWIGALCAYTLVSATVFFNLFPFGVFYLVEWADYLYHNT